LEFSIRSWDFDNDKNVDKRFHKEFFNFFNRKKTGNDYVFTVKNDFLLANYKDFLCEFYQLIEEDLCERAKITMESELLKIKDMDSFRSAFEHYARNGHIPDICSSRGMVSVLGCNCIESRVFYFGSYKAYLEEYTTFTHFERILVKAMKNPLAKIVKFCEYS
jgi:hypothetical protein